MDRRLARKNILTAMVCMMIILTMFGLSFVAAWVYN
jgi:hypothetical protein